MLTIPYSRQTVNVIVANPAVRPTSNGFPYNGVNLGSLQQRTGAGGDETPSWQYPTLGVSGALETDRARAIAATVGIGAGPTFD